MIIKHNNRAYSLIEISCVCAILSLILLSSQQQLSQIRSRLIFHNFFNQLSNELKQLQRRAQVENSEQYFEIELNRLNFSQRDDVKTLKIPINARVVFPIELPKQYPFYKSNVNQAFNVTFENKYTRCSIIVSLRGRVRKTCSEI
jgi:hypothetical protein